MGINKPYHRNYRGFIKGENSDYSSWAYIIDRKYAQSPEHNIRAFLLIQNDLIKLFEYIEPSPESLKTYSYRIHELLMRTCIEIEANFKAIFTENKFTPEQNRFGDIYNMSVYKKANKTHRLSSYQVELPIWNGRRTRVFMPFLPWDRNESLPWYQAFNASKHDRRAEFKQANIKNLVDAVSALLILLSSQFKTEDFSPETSGIAMEGNDYHNLSPALGGYFRIGFPTDWPEEEKYEFNWSNLKEKPHRFEKIDYDEI